MSHPTTSTGSESRTRRSPRRRPRDARHLLHDLSRLDAGTAGRSETRDTDLDAPGRDDGGSSHAAEELRRRVASELHDGVLQVLTAIAVRLDAADMMMDSRPDDARELINEIGKTVRAEQREIRMFVDELKGSEDRSVAGRIPMRRRIRSMLDRVESMWGVSCRLTCRGHLPDDMEVGRTVLRLVQEASVNAIRHGNATHIAVRIRRAADNVRLVVSDNGCGFDFGGSLGHDLLVASRLGPVLLKRRVVEAGGRLRIVSSGEGTHIFIRVPCEPVTRPFVH